MKKIKTIVACSLAVCVLSAISLTSLAVASKVKYDLYYTGTSVGSILNRTYKINGYASRYKVYLVSTSHKCGLNVSIKSDSVSVYDRKTVVYIKRHYSSDSSIEAKGSIIHGEQSGGVIGYCESVN